jgi:dihydrofolate reductase
MPKLIYQAIASLDGYVEDEAGNFDWAAPDDDVHAFVNDLERPIGTYLYGRRMYETMVFWETVSTGTDQSVVSRDFAEIWRAAEKVVYSRSLETVSSTRTRIERDLDPDVVRRLKETSTADITIGGAEWQAGAPRRAPRTARTPRRAPVRKRRHLSSVPRQRLTQGSSCEREELIFASAPKWRTIGHLASAFELDPGREHRLGPAACPLSLRITVTFLRVLATTVADAR